MNTWREYYRPIIRRILEETNDLPEPERTAVRRRKRRDAYPASERRGWAYICWLDEWRRQLGLVPHPRVRPDVPIDQLQLPHIDQMSLPGVD